MATKMVSKEISIPAIDIRQVTFKVVGDTPLIMHAWDEKIKQQMLDKMMGKAKTKMRDLKDPVREFIQSMYWLDGKPEEATEKGFMKSIESGKAKFGFPSVAFKAAAVSGGYRGDVTKNKVSMNGAFHILGEFVEIKGNVKSQDMHILPIAPKMREDMVRVANGAPDIRYRGMFEDWIAILDVEYNAGVLSDEQLLNLFNIGGFAVGVGEWRVEKGGIFGRYHVE
jgi:hypothetical protein